MMYHSDDNIEHEMENTLNEDEWGMLRTTTATTTEAKTTPNIKPIKMNKCKMAIIIYERWSVQFLNCMNAYGMVDGQRILNSFPVN